MRLSYALIAGSIISSRHRLREPIERRTAGWWQACEDLDLPGFDATAEAGANFNAMVGNEAVDPISGSVPHRSYLCQVSAWADA